MGTVAVGHELVDPAALARARAAGYALLGRLVDESVTAETIERARTSPRMAPLLAAASLESLAVDHCHVFDLTAPPFEGMVADKEARVGHLAALRLRQTMAAVGVTVAEGAEPEHLASQLQMMSQLADNEAHAACDPASSQRARRSSAMMLDQHLLHWLLPYEAAVARCGRAFPTALLAETVDLALHHRASLSELAPGSLPLVGGDASALDLDAPDTDLRTIAAFLVRPAASGVVLTRDDITRLGRNVRVPRGFGDRQLLLFNLMRNAAGLGELERVASGLALISSAQSQAMSRRLAPFGPDLSYYLAWWDRKLELTGQILRRMQNEARRHGAES